MATDLKRDNDYCCVAFKHKKGAKNGEKIGFMRFVHRLTDYAKYLDRNNVDWYYFNVYNRRNQDFIKRYYHDQEIPIRP